MRVTPKGIDSITLRQVLDLLAGEPENVFSTDTVALRLSLSRTTARRYLEYLESEDRVDVDLNYGQRGGRSGATAGAGRVEMLTGVHCRNNKGAMGSLVVSGRCTFSGGFPFCCRCTPLQLGGHHPA